MDKYIDAFIARLPNDNRKTIILRLLKLAMKKQAAEIARQQELAAKATPATTWLNSLEHVAKPDRKKK